MRRIDHVAIRVSDVERSIAWYTSMLGLERRAGDPWTIPVFLCVERGGGCLSLFPTEGGSSKGPPGGDTVALDHLAFEVDGATWLRARAGLLELGITPTINDHQAQVSMYFPDPDGHEIELTTYDAEAVRQAGTGEPG